MLSLLCEGESFDANPPVQNALIGTPSPPKQACYDHSRTMPIYEYECRACGHQFELLVLKPTVAACPSCTSQDLEQLLSGFAVSSEAISKANVQAARRKLATSSNYKDQRVAEAEEIKEHSPPPPPTPRKRK